MSNGKLLRVLGVAFGLAVIVGNTIGAGIVKTPGEVAAQIPNPSLFLGMWVLGGVYALLGSLSIVELATMIPRAGGQYAYSQRALGPYAGFVVGWSDWLSTCGTTAAVTIVIGEYTVALVPSLKGGETAIASAVTILFGLVQWRGVKWGGRTQEVLSLLKTAAFFALIAACFLFGGRADVSSVPAPPTMAQAATLFGAVVIALQSLFYTYDGWAGVTYFSEEVKDPARDIPRSTFLGVLTVMAIYVLLNAALVYVLPIGLIAGNSFAPGVAMGAIFGPRGEQALRLLIILSMLAGINAYHLMATRTLFAMSRDGLGPRVTQRVNAGGTPTAALLASVAVALVFLLRSFGQVIAVLGFLFVVNYTLSFASLFALRRREPRADRPYRAWGYPWTTGVSLVLSVAFLVGALAGDAENRPYVIGLLVATYPIYWLIRRAQTSETIS